MYLIYIDKLIQESTMEPQRTTNHQKHPKEKEYRYKYQNI